MYILNQFIFDGSLMFNASVQCKCRKWFVLYVVRGKEYSMSGFQLKAMTTIVALNITSYLKHIVVAKR